MNFKKILISLLYLFGIAFFSTIFSSPVQAAQSCTRTGSTSYSYQISACTADQNGCYTCTNQNQNTSGSCTVVNGQCGYCQKADTTCSGSKPVVKNGNTCYTDYGCIVGSGGGGNDANCPTNDSPTWSGAGCGFVNNATPVPTPVPGTPTPTPIPPCTSGSCSACSSSCNGTQTCTLTSKPGGGSCAQVTTTQNCNVCGGDAGNSCNGSACCDNTYRCSGGASGGSCIPGCHAPAPGGCPNTGTPECSFCNTGQHAYYACNVSACCDYTYRVVNGSCVAQCHAPAPGNCGGGPNECGGTPVPTGTATPVGTGGPTATPVIGPTPTPVPTQCQGCFGSGGACVTATVNDPSQCGCGSCPIQNQCSPTSSEGVTPSLRASYYSGWNGNNPYFSGDDAYGDRAVVAVSTNGQAMVGIQLLNQCNATTQTTNVTTAAFPSGPAGRTLTMTLNGVFSATANVSSMDTGGGGVVFNFNGATVNPNNNTITLKETINNGSLSSDYILWAYNVGAGGGSTSYVMTWKATGGGTYQIGNGTGSYDQAHSTFNGQTISTSSQAPGGITKVDSITIMVKDSVDPAPGGNIKPTVGAFSPMPSNSSTAVVRGNGAAQGAYSTTITAAHNGSPGVSPNQYPLSVYVVANPKTITYQCSPNATPPTATNVKLRWPVFPNGTDQFGQAVNSNIYCVYMDYVKQGCTNDNTNYLLTDVPNGTHTFDVYGWYAPGTTCDQSGQCTSNGNPGSDTAVFSGTLAEGTFSTNNGVCSTGTTYSISGNVFLDANGNKLLDNGESNYQGNISISSSTGNVLYPSAGSYTVTGLSAGTYTITYTNPPAGYNVTTPTATGGTYVYNVTLGATCGGGGTCDANGNITNLNFGINNNTHTISGSVFVDANGNGIKDNGEVNYSNGGITINSTGGSVSYPAPGTFLISGLAPNTNYAVQYTSLPGGYQVTYPLNGPPPTFSVGVGDSQLTCSAGSSNSATCDANGNISNLNFGIKTGGEPWICIGCGSNDGGGGSCGDGVCSITESSSSCPSDCGGGNTGGGSCGDNICSQAESTSGSCPVDCGGGGGNGGGGNTTDGGGGGDVRLDNGVNNPIPVNASSACGGPYMVHPSNGGDPGVVFSGNNNADFGSGQASVQNWVVQSPDGQSYRPPTPNTIRTSYGYLLSNANQQGLTQATLDQYCSNGLTNCQLSNNIPSGFYLSNGDLTLTGNYTFPANKNYIILVHGNMNINGQVHVPKTTTVIFSASGDITVNKNIGEATNTSKTADLEGVYSADGSFIIDGTNDCAVGPDLRLNIAGNVIANAGLTGGSFVNRRDLCAGNVCPAVSLSPRLDMTLNLPPIIKTPNYIWQEVAP